MGIYPKIFVFISTCQNVSAFDHHEGKNISAQREKRLIPRPKSKQVKLFLDYFTV